MDPVSMILALALKNPDVTATTIEKLNQPGQVEVARLDDSLADFAMQTLACYHKSARFRGVELLAPSWNQQSKFGAEHAIVMRIQLQGFSGIGYQMIVAAMAKEGSYRTFVINENTSIPYSKKCSLEYWTPASNS